MSEKTDSTTIKTDESVRRQLGGAGASLSEGSIAKQLIRLTVPMLAGFGSMMSASLIDTYFVGQIGTLEVAAVTLTFPLIMVFMGLSMGFGVGATSIIARTAGAGSWKSAQLIATHTLVLVILFVSGVVALGFVFTEDIFYYMGAEEELLPIAIQYTYINLIGVPVLALPMIGSMMLRSFNDPKTPAIIMIGGSILQVIFAPILIWGIGDWNGFGVYGSAWAFVLSRFVMFIYAMRVFHSRGLIQPLGTFESFRRSVIEVMRLALPSMLTQLLMPISMYLLVTLIAQYPKHVVAAWGIATRIESLAMVLVMALSSSIGPFVGQNFGSGRYDRIEGALRLAYTFSFFYGLVLAAILAMVGDDLTYLFRDDPEVVDVARMFFYIVPITIGVMSFSQIGSSTFVAFGEPMPSFVMSIARMFILLIPLCYLFDHLMEYVGIFVGIAITNVLAGLLAWVWLKIRMSRFDSPVGNASAPVAAS